MSAFQSVHKQLSGVCNLGKHERQNAKSPEVSGVGLIKLLVLWFVAFSLKPRRQSLVNLTFFRFAPPDLPSSHQFPLFNIKSRS